jgi:hypothetical protein
LHVPVRGQVGTVPQTPAVAATRPGAIQDAMKKIPAGTINLNALFMEHLRKVKVKVEFKCEPQPLQGRPFLKAILTV